MSDIGVYRDLVESFYDTQVLRIAISHRLRHHADPDLEWHKKSLLASEERYKERFAQEIENVDIWQVWLKHVKGIGPVMAMGLHAWIGDISRFPNTSKLHMYSGYGVVTRCRNCDHRLFEKAEEQLQWTEKMTSRFLELSKKRKRQKPMSLEEAQKRVRATICHCRHPEPVRVGCKRKRGELAEWNPRLKTHVWKVVTQLNKAKGDYHKLYQQYRDEYTARGDRKGVSHPRAMRKVAKLFLSHYWEVARQLKGLPSGKAYVFEKLGHTTYIPPIFDKKKEEEAIT